MGHKEKNELFTVVYKNCGGSAPCSRGGCKLRYCLIFYGGGAPPRLAKVCLRLASVNHKQGPLNLALPRKGKVCTLWLALKGAPPHYLPDTPRPCGRRFLPTFSSVSSYMDMKYNKKYVLVRMSLVVCSVKLFVSFYALRLWRGCTLLYCGYLKSM